MNENRSSNTLRCSRSISNGRNSDIGDRLLAMVRLANTRLWTNGLRSARLSPDSRSLEANATGSLWSSADGNSPTDGDARGHYRGRTGWPSGNGLQELPLGRHSLRWPAHHSGPHHGNHHRNLGSTSSPRSLVSLVENIQKVSREIHPGSRSNLRGSLIKSWSFSCILLVYQQRSAGGGS